MATTDRYESVQKMLNLPMPAWVSNPADALRVAAYDGYQDMYDNNIIAMAVALRGDNDKPVMIPGAKRIVETTNRYLAKGFTWTVTSESSNVQAQAETAAYLASLGTREEFYSKFFSLKRRFLTQGDGLLLLSIDPSRPALSRLSISEINPRTYFKIPSATNDDSPTGCYLVDLIYADDGKTQIARRLEYRFDPSGSGQIYTKLTFWDTNGWDDRYATSPATKPVPVPAAYASIPSMQPILTGFLLPSSITALPVYHYRNQRTGGEPYGTSQLCGMETLIAGLNQTLSDEDITLALQGLGLYVTNSPRPRDEDGNETDWTIAPGYVLELNGGPDLYMKRVDGVGNVQPYQDHLKFMRDVGDESAALPKAAVGNVDASVAASGVALRLEMAPIIASNEEKEVELLSRSNQLFHDILAMWAPLDGFNAAPDIVVHCSTADPLPKDRKETIAEVASLVAAGLMSRAFAIGYLQQELGFQFPDNMLVDIEREMDTAGARVEEELGAMGDPNAAPTAPAPAGAVA